MIKDYYKKIDKTIFDHNMTIPNEYIDSFCYGKHLEVGTARSVVLRFKGTEYEAKLRHVNSKKGPYYALHWFGNYEFQSELNKEFVQSFIAVESAKYIHSTSGEKRKFKTNLSGGQQEVLIFTPVSENVIELKTFIKVETAYNALFEKQIEAGVFSWLNVDISKRTFFQKTTGWLNINALEKHTDEAYVIYYLVDDTKKEVYIGSTKKLGERVKPGREEIPGWNRFRYEILLPRYREFLRAVEYHSIVSYAHFFNNKRNKDLGFSEYKLVNKDLDPKRFADPKKQR